MSRNHVRAAHARAAVTTVPSTAAPYRIPRSDGRRRLGREALAASEETSTAIEGLSA